MNKSHAFYISIPLLRWGMIKAVEQVHLDNHMQINIAREKASPLMFSILSSLCVTFIFSSFPMMQKWQLYQISHRYSIIRMRDLTSSELLNTLPMANLSLMLTHVHWFFVTGKITWLILLLVKRSQQESSRH